MGGQTRAATPGAQSLRRETYRRRPARVVRVGDLAIGGEHPIVIQSMTVADTLDTASVVREIASLVAAGCPLVRVTCPSVREARNLAAIKTELAGMGIRVPLVADIHFTPSAALEAAEVADKVRINPGNFADRKKFAVREYSDAEYRAELERIHERFAPLVLKLKRRGVALRIGANHGSLSDRILNRYGDTPLGMVESALEFVRICRANDFHDIVLSMKSSVARVAIEAHRLLVERMAAEGMDYPIHLGVTEAGAGLPARLKSAIGIGALLAEGIGDTIRVSLTEPSENEIAACREILLGVARMEPGFVPYLPEDLRERLERGASAGGGSGRAGTASSIRPRADSPAGGGAIPRASAVTMSAWRAPRPPSIPIRSETPRIDLGHLPLGGPPDAPVRVHYRAAHPLSRSDHLIAELRGIERADGDGSEIEPEAFWIAAPPGEDAPRRMQELLRGLRGSWAQAVPLVVRVRLRDPEDARRLEDLFPWAHGIAVAMNGHSDAGVRDALGRLLRASREARRPLFWDGMTPERAVDLHRRSSDAGMEAAVFVPGGPNVRRSAWEIREALARDGTADETLLILEGRGTPIEQALDLGPALLETGGAAVLVGPEGAATGHHPSAIAADASAPVADPLASASARAMPLHISPLAAGYGILQAARLRLHRAEFISCPSCGRTQFDLETTTARIQRRTGHLKGVKIAVMGCIVNGPGEMADADFGYVGSGANKVDLYKGRIRVRRNLSPAEADEALVELIKASGRWTEPEEGRRRAPG